MDSVYIMYFEDNMDEIVYDWCEHYVLENGHDVFTYNSKGDEVPDWFIEQHYEKYRESLLKTNEETRRE